MDRWLSRLSQPFAPQDHPVKRGEAMNIFLWVLQIALAAMFLMAGGSKLAGSAAMVQLFNAVALGQWFRYFTGALEVISAALLLIPGMAGFGAAILIPVMLGAIATHLLVIHTSPALPVGLLVGSAIVLWGRRAQIAERFGR
jgi:uncharacterized membrane protein YphA (DoxX/SURF4 family)